MTNEEELTPEEEAEQIREDFAEEYQDYNLEKMVEDIQQYRDMNVSSDERRRALLTSVTDDIDSGISREELLGIEGEEGGGGADEVNIGGAKDLSGDQWVSLEGVRVLEAEGHDSDAISQHGRIGDDSGTIRFVSWEKSDLPELEEGQSYNLSPVVTDEYQGSVNSVKLNSATEIEQRADDVEVDESADMETFEGVLVSIMRDRSGFIRRDSETGQFVESDSAAEEIENDLRIIGTLDDGTTTYDGIVISRELCEELTGIGLDEATDMAMDSLDRSVVIDAMAERTLGRYYRVRGIESGRYVYANEVEELGEPDVDEELLIRARSIQ